MGKTVIIAGSGLSRSLAGIPTQQEGFLDEVLGKCRIRWVFAPLLNFIREEEIKIIKRWEKPELLLSYLYYQDQLIGRPKKENTEYTIAIINFRMALNEYLKGKSIDSNIDDEEKECKDNNKKESFNLARGNFKILLERFNVDNNGTVITTNYDLIIESFLKNNNNSVNYDYCLINDGKAVNKCKLLKLHGSINWLEEREFVDPPRKIKPRYKNKCLIKHINNNWNKFNEINKVIVTTDKDNYNCCYYKHDNRIYTPVTIPFFFQKYNWYGERWRCLFKDIVWERAKEEIRDAKNLIFIGYGFPDADFPVLALLNKAEWWKKNIIAISRNADEFHKVGITFKCFSGRYLQDFNIKDFSEWLDCALSSYKDK